MAKMVAGILIVVLLQITGNGLLVPSNAAGDVPSPDDVVAAPTGIGIPLGRFLIVRIGSECCAVKFVRAWNGNNKEDNYATYQLHRQGDGTGDFSKQHSEYREGELSFKFRGIFRLQFQVGDPALRCGSTKILWFGGGAVSFFETGKAQGDYGIELAPTPWTDISQVDIRDSRLKWYRYDENRKTVYIPIDKLWEDTSK